MEELMNNKEMCAVIQVQVENGYPNGAYINRRFEVSYKENIEGIIESIKNFGIENDIPFTKVVSIGHSLTSSRLWTEEEIINHIKKFAVTETKKR
jgi:hypothetical protein